MASRAKPLVAENTSTVVCWAWVGAAILLFMLFVFANWFLSGRAVPTDPGPDPISAIELQFIYWVQAAAVVLGIVALTFFVILPWRRQGQATTPGMLYICWLTLFFQDPMMSYSSASLLYNSHMVNLGSWTLGAMPGWMSPNGSNLPEPLLLIIVGYTIIGYSLCFPVLAGLNAIKARRPRISRFHLAIIGVLALIALDTLFETLLLRTGVYAYPAGIAWMTLFAGETYQFPLSEGLTYGGGVIGSTLVLLLYRDDRGQTWVERGLDQVRLSSTGRQWVKFFALFAYVHVCMFALFFIPTQWFAMHGDSFPKGYPSYMTNGLCAYGPAHNECPGPGVSIPRPVDNPWNLTPEDRP